MGKSKQTLNRSGVDKGLVALFLKMSPEERLRANDNAVRAILEMRNAFKQRLAVLEETLRQLSQAHGVEDGS
jgi:hypothetical protein